MRIQLMDVVIDVERAEMRRHDERVAIEPKVLALIAFLCEHAGESITSERLIAEIWPDAATTRSSLTRAISLARAALGDRRGDPFPTQIIETIRGHGYRLNPDVRVELDAGRGGVGEPDANASLFAQVERSRARVFVGRRRELTRLERLLDPEPIASVAYVYGPGGVGKSELLAAFARRCRSEGRSIQWLAAAQLGTSGDELRAKFEDFDVIFLDGAEGLGGLTSLLSSELLPSLAASQRVVIAGRDRPDAAWIADSGIRELLDAFELANQSEQDSRAYLTLRGVPEEHHARIVRTTFGHPLALGLVAEVFKQGASAALELRDVPDVVQSLLDRLLATAPSPEHRRALWCASIPRALPAELLDAMMPGQATDEYFEWLARLSFMRRLPEGLVPHDIARSTIFADLSWRAPAARRELGRRALEYFCDRAEREPLRAHEFTRDISHAYRTEAKQTIGAVPRFYSSNVKSEDWPELEELVEQHEGSESLDLLRSWRDAPIDVDVLRDAGGEIAAFQLGIWIHRLSEAEAAQDPGVVGLHRHMQALGAIDDPRGIYYSRFWMARKSHHRASAAAHAIADTIWGKTLRYSHALGFFVHTNATGYIDVNPHSIEHWDALDFEIGGRRYGVLGHDFRHEPIMDWLRRSVLWVFDAVQA